MKPLKKLLFLVALILLNSSCGEPISDLVDATTLENREIEIVDEVTVDEVVEADTIQEEVAGFDNRKYVYLTIDDGPLYGASYIDSVVTAQQVKTNLFVVGSGVDGSNRFKKYYQKFEENNYIEIYNHSYSHANHKYSSYYNSPDLVLEDFSKNESVLSLGHKIARLPGRNLWIVGNRSKNMKQSGSTSAELLANEGYDIYGWDIEWEYDHKNYTPKQSIDELIDQINLAHEKGRTFTPNHVVLLMHDQMFSKMNGKNDLGDLISKLKENGYAFEYMSAYPKMKN